MINVSDLKKPEPKKINVKELLKEIEQDALNHKLAPDGRMYDLSYDLKGVEEVKKVLVGHGFDVLHNLTGYRDGFPQITLWVSLKK